MERDLVFMGRALELAKVRKGLTHPNPTVGCVIVKNGKIVGEGFHRKAGEPHAEVVALQRAGKEAEGSTVYVTLEPCSHYGRTPPCSLALINARVKRVVIATVDPNPKVAGRGIEMLKRAGIEVKVGLLKEEADKLNEDFFWWITRKRPFVVLKVAQTLDGFIATSKGESKWITNRESRRKVHLLRCQSDAVLVGVGTVLKDNPQLTVRSVPCERQPLRVILDKDLKTPLDANVTDTSKVGTLIFTASTDKRKIERFLKRGVEVVRAPTEENNPNLLNLEWVLDYLGKEKEVVQLLVEGGSSVFGSFLRRKLFNRLVVFVAPKVFGKGISPFGGFEIDNLQEVEGLKLLDFKRFGNDVMLEYGF